MRKRPVLDLERGTDRPPGALAGGAERERARHHLGDAAGGWVVAVEWKIREHVRGDGREVRGTAGDGGLNALLEFGEQIARHDETQLDLALGARAHDDGAIDPGFERTEQTDRCRCRDCGEELRLWPAGDLVAQALAQGAVRIEPDHIAQVPMDVLVVPGPRSLPTLAPRGNAIDLLDDDEDDDF